MKIKILLFLVFSLAKLSFAQINVGLNRYGGTITSAGKLSEDVVTQFKNTTTVLILPETEKTKLEEYKNAITPFAF